MDLRSFRVVMFGLVASTGLACSAFAQESKPAPKPPANPTSEPKPAPKAPADKKDTSAEDEKDNGKFPTKMDVPADMAKQGKVYTVMSGRREKNMKFTSDAPNEKIEGYSRFTVGYAVAGPEDNMAALKGAEFRLPVASIRTGNTMRDGHLQAENWLDAAKFPNISFKVKEVKDVKAQEGPKNPNIAGFNATLVGDMTLHGVTKQMEIPAVKLRFLKESAASSVIGPGDLMFIECKYKVKFADFGVKNDAISDKKKVAEEIEITTSLFMTNGEVAEKKEAPKPAKQ